MGERDILRRFNGRLELEMAVRREPGVNRVAAAIAWMRIKYGIHEIQAGGLGRIPNGLRKGYAYFGTESARRPAVAAMVGVYAVDYSGESSRHLFIFLGPMGMLRTISIMTM